MRHCVRIDGQDLRPRRDAAGHGSDGQQYVGTLLDGKYRIESFISAGGMGSVYRAVHVMLDKTVAVKVIKNELVTSDEIVARFQREARAASNLEHPNIVTVYDLGQTAEGTLYIAMEFIDGPSLKEMIRKNGPLAPREAIDILRQVASALSAAHRKQVVHRDLKSDNLMLETDGDRKVVKLVDFGIAKTFDDSTQLTAAGYMLGTPHYMSPEQAAGKSVDHRADLYSLGVILYEMLTGELPFGDHALTSLLVKLATETPSPPSSRRPEHVPPALDAVAMRCLEKDPERRFQSADEFTAALNRALVEIEHPAATPPPIPGAEKTLLRPADGHQITNARAVTNVSTNLHQITQAPAAAHQVPTPPPVSEQHIPAASPRPGLDAASLAKRVAAVVVVLGVVVAAIVYGLRLRTTSPHENSPITTARQPQSTPAPQPITSAPVPVPVTPGATVPPAPAPVATAPPSPIDDGRGVFLDGMRMRRDRRRRPPAHRRLPRRLQRGPRPLPPRRRRPSRNHNHPLHPHRRPRPSRRRHHRRSRSSPLSRFPWRVRAWRTCAA